MGREVRDANIGGCLQFQGEWRVYQQRILDHADEYLKDGKVHIVAPPGSGKTTLGIELLRRMGRPCLILSPSIVIRQQWLERIQTAFLQGDTEGVLSGDIRKPAAITAITYQALHAAMEKLRITEETGEGKQEQTEDYTGFDLMKTVREAGIGTICLDECHHLRSEWWKALESFMAKLGSVAVVSLTATPPYDSTLSQWERYIGMCGEIDEEIIVPELVKDGSLCPHQDFVYFNYPSMAEKEQIKGYRRGMELLYQELLEDARLAELAATHKGIRSPGESADSMLENPPYLAAILAFMEYKKLPYPTKWLRILGVRHLPSLAPKHLEALLQGLLFDDSDSYGEDDGYRMELLRRLKLAKAVEGRTVAMTSNKAMEKLLISSLGKLDSIREIVLTEHEGLGKELRLLILTDYIRREYQEVIGRPDKNIEKIGVLPMFEQLRRELDPGIRLGVLCGSIVILPKEAQGYLEKLLHAGNHPFTTGEFHDADGVGIGYIQVTVKGKKQDVVKVITKIFESGYIQVLIGTKALLGEGWDSPCINALILASFVGSFVLSNQMRGRAIRSCPGEPDKTSNIWHLVCLDTDKETEINRFAGIREEELSEDYAMLARRMKGFLGVNYQGCTIENGIARLGLRNECYTRKEVHAINQDMKRCAMDREGLRSRWEQAMVLYDRMEVVDESEIPKDGLKLSANFFNLIGYELINIVVLILNFNLYRLMLLNGYSRLGFLFCDMVTSVIAVLAFRFGGKLVKMMTPLNRLKDIGEGMRQALMKAGLIESECQVRVEESLGLRFHIYLLGASAREKDLFATCVEEFLGMVDNQRYLLYSRKRWRNMQDCYRVPEVFCKKKEDAERFRNVMCKWIGDYQLIYTRGEEGRKVLLKARARAFANQQKNVQDIMEGRKKTVKRALE